MSAEGAETPVPGDVVSIGATSGLQYVHITAAMAVELEALELASFPTAEPGDLYDRHELMVLAGDFAEGGVLSLIHI